MLDIELSEKIKHATSDQTIRICYAGRIDPTTPINWVKAIVKARHLGVNLRNLDG